MSARYDKHASALKRVLPDDTLDRLGRMVAFIRRLRALRASLFVWSVVMSRFGHGWPGFEQARQWYERLGGAAKWRRPFQVRFKARSAVLLFEKAFETTVEGFRSERRARVRHPLTRRFAEVAVVDSTTVRVDDSLRPRFKGTGRKGSGSGAALIKVLFTISAFGLVPLHALLTTGSSNDTSLFPPLDIFAKRTLLLFDKGFFSYDLLGRIRAAGLHYLCPLKRYCIPKIIAVHQAPQRVRRALAANSKGVPLRDFLPRKARVSSVWDIDVLLDGRFPARVVIVPGPGPERIHRAYVTTLHRAEWPPAALPELYRLRWQIELVFKELKQNLNLERIPTKDQYAAQVLIWASLIALSVSRTIATSLFPATDKLGLARDSRPALTTRALRATARLVGIALAQPARAALLWQLISEEIRRELAAITVGRPDSFARLEGLAPL